MTPYTAERIIGAVLLVASALYMLALVRVGTRRPYPKPPVRDETTLRVVR